MCAATRRWLALAALNGLVAVAAGAFGAHGVSDAQIRALLHTGAQYQLAHAAAGLACVGLAGVAARSAAIAGWLFGIGGLVFGGSLYLLAFTGVRLWGAVTPIGGVLMIAGWATLLWAFMFSGAADPGANARDVTRPSKS